MKPLIVVLTLIVCIAPFRSAAAQAPINFRIDQSDSSKFPQVQLDLTARDANGVPLRDLSVANFSVTEDKTQTPLSLEKLETVVNPDIPLSIILVLDTSGSMKGKPLADMQSAATRFVDRLGAQDRIALLTFHDIVNLDEPFPQLDAAREVDFTSDKQAIYPVIDGLTANGSTPLYDAVYKAVRIAAKQPAGNRAVLLMTDGRDEGVGGAGRGSKIANAEDAIAEANRANIPIFVIGLGNAIDRQYLTRLSLRTGSTFQETPDSAQLAQLFQNAQDLLKQQYRLTYRSAVQPDGKMHNVRVTLKAQDRIAFDENDYGPAGVAPTATAARTRTVAPTTIVPPSPTLLPTAIPTAIPPTAVAPTPVAPPSPLSSENSVLVPALLGILVIAGGTVVLFAMRRRRPTNGIYCANCGRELESKTENCPYCGASDKFERPRNT